MKKPALFLPGAEGEPEDPASANWRGEPEANAQRARRTRNGKNKAGRTQDKPKRIKRKHTHIANQNCGANQNQTSLGNERLSKSYAG